MGLEWEPFIYNSSNLMFLEPSSKRELPYDLALNCQVIDKYRFFLNSDMVLNHLFKFWSRPLITYKTIYIKIMKLHLRSMLQILKQDLYWGALNSFCWNPQNPKVDWKLVFGRSHMKVEKSNLWSLHSENNVRAQF